MITLPTFENAQVSTDELLAEQARLQRQADRLLSATGLMSMFAQYGTVSPIEGSYAYGLMVYPDLDIQIISPNVAKSDFARLVYEVALTDFVRKFSVVDLVRFSPKRAGRPSGYWIGLEIPYENDQWGLDVWLQTPEQSTGDSDRYKRKLANLTPDQTATILSIKYHLIREGLYGQQYFSTDVYDSVIDHGVLTYNDFINYHT